LRILVKRKDLLESKLRKINKLEYEKENHIFPVDLQAKLKISVQYPASVSADRVQASMDKQREFFFAAAQSALEERLQIFKEDYNTSLQESNDAILSSNFLKESLIKAIPDFAQDEAQMDFLIEKLKADFHQLVTNRTSQRSSTSNRVPKSYASTVMDTESGSTPAPVVPSPPEAKILHMLELVSKNQTR